MKVKYFVPNVHLISFKVIELINKVKCEYVNSVSLVFSHKKKRKQRL